MKAAFRSIPALLALAVTLSACGAGPGPNLAGPNGASYMSAYSGEWTLLRLESDDLDAEYREAMAARPGASAGGMPGAGATGGRGGGMTGGRSGGGMTGGRPSSGRMPGAGARMDPEEMQRVMLANQAIARTHRTFTLNLRPESATLIQGDADAIVLTFGGHETTVNLGEVEYFAGAEWTSEGLVIERKVDMGGGVKDKMKVDDEGLLVVEREIDTGRAGKVSGILRYRKN